MAPSLLDSLLLTQESTKLAVWSKGSVVFGRPPNEWRQDAYGNLIRYSDYGNRQSNFGWEFDHIRPDALGGGDNINNLRPLHWKENAKRGAELASILAKKFSG